MPLIVSCVICVSVPLRGGWFACVVWCGFFVWIACGFVLGAWDLLLVGLVVICVCVRKEVCLMGPVVMCSICEFWFLSIRLSCCSIR